MVQITKQILVCGTIIFVAGCAALSTQSGNVQVEDRADVGFRSNAEPNDMPAAEPIPPVAIVSPIPPASEVPRSRQAVTQLLDKARRDHKDEKYDEAAATIERALRMEPRNAELWSYLATIHFDQRHWRQSSEMASRSNSFAGDDKDLQARNWRIIARAREMSGDLDGATQAYSQATRIENN